ncbi:hypothetical protein [Dactylosporangium matsuzakiense]|uniref:Uncharacterized protein n=1 Tax=Dactylosporangium matsuzakiense TaxID=53360 RepID=A0A9W6KU00_9ACTN|nr:hypothetical protein [Dactylosporangium matsuzakiense]GLL08042.1 hypothetical protein GCM10017581_098020 [Dactylosporangium matsuzakiense]
MNASENVNAGSYAGRGTLAARNVEMCWCVSEGLIGVSAVRRGVETAQAVRHRPLSLPRAATLHHIPSVE